MNNKDIMIAPEIKVIHNWLDAHRNSRSTWLKWTFENVLNKEAFAKSQLFFPALAHYLLLNDDVPKVYTKLFQELCDLHQVGHSYGNSFFTGTGLSYTPFLFHFYGQCGYLFNFDTNDVYKPSYFKVINFSADNNADVQTSRDNSKRFLYLYGDEHDLEFVDLVQYKYKSLGNIQSTFTFKNEGFYNHICQNLDISLKHELYNQFHHVPKNTIGPFDLSTMNSDDFNTMLEALRITKDINVIDMFFNQVTLYDLLHLYVPSENKETLTLNKLSLVINKPVSEIKCQVLSCFADVGYSAASLFVDMYDTLSLNELITRWCDTHAMSYDNVTMPELLIS